jgi:CHAD domain-containing protein
MSSSTSPDDAIARLVARYLAQQLSRGAALLSGPLPIDVAAVHEVRKSVKRIRAALRLIRAEDDPRFDDWDRRLRDVNRRLSPTRDLDACRQTIETLLSRESDEHRGLFERLRLELAEERTSSADRQVDAIRQSLAAELDALRCEIAERRCEAQGFELMRPAVKRMVRAARKQIDALRRKTTTKRMHELRKLVKLRLYWMEILSPVWPDAERKEQERVDDLADLLGRHHDLAVLEERLKKSAVGQDRAAKGGRESLRRRRRKLEAQALKRARRLFRERPKEFCRRWDVLVERWRGESECAADIEDAARPAQPR